MMKRALVLLCAVSAAALFIYLPRAVMDAPLSYNLFFTQKIFYYHVPSAFVMFAGCFVAAIASGGYLATRKPAWDDVGASASGAVVVLGAIVLTTGPIWARPAWGVWWTWEARLTSALLLWLVFVAYGIIRRYGGPGSDRLAAGLAVFGGVNVPLVYYSVNMWRTMHPTTDVVPSLSPAMRGPFLVGTLAYFALFGVLLAARVALVRGERRVADVQELALDAGVE
jgi:heme exporter protein C